MTPHVPLSGLDRLRSVCRQHALPLRLAPPMASAPKQGEAIFGEPLDPQLASMYQVLGGAELGPISIYRPDSEWDGLIPWNVELREYHSILFQASHIFARETGFALYYATVPRLAGSQGLQPVIYIQAMEFPSAVPVASSVDRFFDTYSRYLELMVVDPEYIASGNPAAVFPWSVKELIAGDEPLMAQVRAGRFDFLTQEDEEAHRWVEQLCATPRAPR